MPAIALSLTHGRTNRYRISRTARRCLGEASPLFYPALEAVVALAAQRPDTLSDLGGAEKADPVAYARQSRRSAKALRKLSAACALYQRSRGADEDLVNASEGYALRVEIVDYGDFMVYFTPTKGLTYRTAAVHLVKRAARLAQARQHKPAAVRFHAHAHSEEE